MGLALKDTEYHRYTDYLQWTDNNCELIDGKAYFMSPAPNLDHQEVAGEVYKQIENALTGKKSRVYIALIDVRLANQCEVDEQIDTVVQPDVLDVYYSNKLECHGVREYWLFHPTDRVLTIYLLKDNEFSKAVIVAFAGETAITVLDDVVIQWNELFMRLPQAKDRINE
ncbi:MAG: Uma2 family endonuclease [Gammaproteobacteria bacterium]|nr:Uma2 family endonuclease [Gammaproteobacteria bacterium]MBT4146934.1 Uma2 family endonuclease [Gammaproteobacteria bacterium]MBT5222108.1 Uma2 family endonuclease [Gammaproteobacteria bacterium]MBT5825615.1 Uma2 family endonuclease [Gammaproteobacteria bacterium]MBT5966070.1 Uma2 family endonuclease [Gammaproteobacteria bacterium]